MVQNDFNSNFKYSKYKTNCNYINYLVNRLNITLLYLFPNFQSVVDPINQ